MAFDTHHRHPHLSNEYILRKAGEINRCYYEGYHWATWIGPTVPDVNRQSEIKKVFQSANIIKDCLDFWAACLIGRGFEWFLKGADGERAEGVEDIEKQLQRWLDWAAQQCIERGTEHSDPWFEFVLNLGIEEQAALRLFMPQRYANADEELKKIHLQALKSLAVGVVRDDDGFIDKVEYTYGDGKSEKHEWVDGAIAVTVNDEPIPNPPSRWMLQVVNGLPLITDSVRRLQDAINHGLTMKLKNQEVAGFRERIFLNAQAPGEWVEDGNGGETFIPAKVMRGPETITYLPGLTETRVNADGDESEVYAAPSVYDSEPIDPEMLIKSFEADIALIYRQFKQGFRLANSDGSTLSGSSRVQQRQEFEDYLLAWQPRIEGAIANVLNVVLELLGHDYETVVTLRCSTGKLTPEERQAVITEYQAGLISKTTAMATLGTAADIDAELELMKEEQAEAMAARPIPDVPEPDEDEDEPEETPPNEGGA